VQQKKKQIEQAKTDPVAAPVRWQPGTYQQLRDGQQP
jgi:hypothetical protein